MHIIRFMAELKNPHILRRIADDTSKAFKAGDDMMMINESVLRRVSLLTNP